MNLQRCSKKSLRFITENNSAIQFVKYNKLYLLNYFNILIILFLKNGIYKRTIEIVVQQSMTGDSMILKEKKNSNGF